jgi:hypothetical protein
MLRYHLRGYLSYPPPYAYHIFTKVDGAKYQDNPHGNLYYPNRELREKLFRYGLELHV